MNESEVWKQFSAHNVELNDLWRECNRFTEEYGIVPNTVFVGREHWLAIAGVVAIYGLSVIVVDPHESIIGLIKRGDEGYDW